jgi:hypothetical protein
MISEMALLLGSCAAKLLGGGRLEGKNSAVTTSKINKANTQNGQCVSTLN